MSSAAPPRERSAYTVWTEYRTRWTDNDQFGHINNALYYGFFDSAINATLIERLGFAPTTDPTVYFVAQTGCTFHAAIAYPSIVEVGVRLARLGTSSLTYEVGVFAAGESLAGATGHFVHVHVDRSTERPVALSEAQRQAFSALYALESERD